jgi:hypothetical protein
MPGVEKMRAGAQAAWNRAKIITRHTDISIIQARQLYRDLPETLRTDDVFWKELELGDKRTAAHRRLLASLGTPAPRSHKPRRKKITTQIDSNQPPIIVQHNGDDQVFRRLVLNLGLIRSQTIIDQIKELVDNGQK